MLLTGSMPLTTSVAKATDGELPPEVFERCQAGERAALEQFVQHYERRVFALLSRALGAGPRIDDLAQEVFIRAYRNLRKFDPQGPARLSTWLLSIAYNVIVDARRRSKSRSVELSVQAVAVSDQATPEQQYWHGELNSALARAAAMLPAEQRDAFILAEFHEMDLVEIGRITGARAATVKTRLFRARTRLRALLAPVWEDAE